MSNLVDVWRRRSNDQLIEAAQRIEEYTDEGQRVIRAELQRRAIAEPPRSAGRTSEDAIEKARSPQSTTFGKVSLTALSWLVTTLLCAAAIELTDGRARPGFVPLASLPLLAPIVIAIWWTHRPFPRLLRECLWVSGSAQAFMVFVITIVTSGLESAAPRAGDWLAGVVALYVVTAAVRALRCAARHAAMLQSFVRVYWSDFLIVIGVCVVAFGWASANHNDDERTFIVIGAGMTTAGVLAWVRSRRDQSHRGL